jgi:hypothetical protein
MGLKEIYTRTGKRRSLPRDARTAFGYFVFVLIGETIIHLGAARVILLPGGLRRCGAGKAGERNECTQYRDPRLIPASARAQHGRS